MRKINTLLIILISVNITLFAQNRVIKHKIDNNYLIDGILRANMVGTYDYNYYEDARGEYVKHGNFKMSGNDVMEIVKFRKKIIIKESFVATGKFVDGWLDGLLTIKRRIQDNENEFQEWTLMANFKNGLPHGEWKTVYKDIGTDNTYAICHFNEGEMVGDVNLNWWKGNNGDFTTSLKKSMKGTLDSESRYHGTWNVESADGSVDEYHFEHGVLCRAIYRDKDGNVKNKEDQNPESVQKVNEVALKYVKGELDKEGVESLGFKVEYADRIKADDILDFMAFDKKSYFASARKLIGGQKYLPTDKCDNCKYLIQKDYMVIKYLPPVPDDIMENLINIYKKQIKECLDSGMCSYVYMGNIDNNLSRKYNCYQVVFDGPNVGSIFSVKDRNHSYIPDQPTSDKNYNYQYHQFSKESRVRKCTAGGYFVEEDLYFTLLQRDTINKIIRQFQDIAFEYAVKQQTSKYYKIIRDTNNRYTFWGYFKKGDFIEGCEHGELVYYVGGSPKIDNIKQVPIIWDTIENQMNILESIEKTLKKNDPAIYEQYRKNLSKDLLCNDPEISKKRIESRLQTIGNYSTFNSNKYTIKTLNTKIEKIAKDKPEYVNFFANYQSFYNSIDFNIYDSVAIQDNDRMNQYIQTICKYDTLSMLMQQYYSLTNSIEQLIVKYKHISKIFNEYKESVKLPNSIEEINVMESYVKEIQTIYDNLRGDGLDILDKSIKSKKSSEEKMSLLMGKK